MQRPRCRLAPRNRADKNAVIPAKFPPARERQGIHRALFKCRAEEKPLDARLRGNDGWRAIPVQAELGLS